MTQTPFNHLACEPILHEGILQIGGRDAKKLLQGQVTCDLEKVSLSQGQMGALCNVQGRVISVFRLFQFKENYYLLMPLDTLLKTYETLKKYAVFYSVTLRDVSNDVSLFYSDDQAISLPANTLSVETFDESFIAKLSSLNDYLIFSFTPNAAEISENMEWEKFHIRAVIPRLSAATIEKFLPHDLNLPQLQAVDFTKGCYTGQEIIARMHYRGKIKKHLYAARIHSDKPITALTDILIDGNPCGVIVNSIAQAENAFDVLFVCDEESILSNKIYLDNNEVYFTPLPIPYTLTKVNNE